MEGIRTGFWIGAILMLACALFGLMVSGLSPLDVLDIASLLMVIAPALISGAMVGGFSGLGGAFAAVTKKDGTDTNDRARYRVIFETMGNVGLGAGIMGTIIGAIQMMQNITSGDSAAVGRGIAAALITIIYGLVWKYFICVPASAKLSGENG